MAREGGSRTAAGLLGGLLLCLSALPAMHGCGHLERLQMYGADDRMLGRIAARTPEGGSLQGIGTIRIEHKGACTELPFAVTIDANGVLEVEADLGPGFVPGFGQIAIVSDQRDTGIYFGGRRVESAGWDSLGAALRPVLLSLFGGGDMLARCAALNGCQPSRRVVCKGLEIGFTLDRALGSVRRWTVRDASVGVAFNGFVESWDSRGEGVWAIGGLLRPQEIGIQVRYAKLSRGKVEDVARAMVQTPAGASPGLGPEGGMGLGRETGDEKPGNFMKPLWLE